jgi:hypothetical protein
MKNRLKKVSGKNMEKSGGSGPIQNMKVFTIVATFVPLPASHPDYQYPDSRLFKAVALHLKKAKVNLLILMGLIMTVLVIINTFVTLTTGYACLLLSTNFIAFRQVIVDIQN